MTALADVKDDDIVKKGTDWAENYQAEEEAIDDNLFGMIPQTPPEVWARHLRQLVNLERDAQKTQRRMHMWTKKPLQRPARVRLRPKVATCGFGRLCETSRGA